MKLKPRDNLLKHFEHKIVSVSQKPKVQLTRLTEESEKEKAIREYVAKYMQEIERKFKASSTNASYVFPRVPESPGSSSCSSGDSFDSVRSATVYHLASQNYNLLKRVAHHKNYSLGYWGSQSKREGGGGLSLSKESVQREYSTGASERNGMSKQYSHKELIGSLLLKDQSNKEGSPEIKQAFKTESQNVYKISPEKKIAFESTSPYSSQKRHFAHSNSSGKNTEIKKENEGMKELHFNLVVKGTQQGSLSNLTR